MNEPKVKPTREAVRAYLIECGWPFRITEETVDVWLFRLQQAWRDYGMQAASEGRG